MKGNIIIRLCKKTRTVLLKLTVIVGILTVVFGSNPDLKMVFEQIALISIGLAIAIDFTKEAVVDQKRKEWVTE